ncbi:MAG: fatty acid hydroxylase [Acidobacteria bacterium]|nr:MAG: fatty acid hydroxylase [Acidobacteriota bacterium]REJ99264.1 MAG: fatty acid hydroxylase [Acidobacteriota bacterium]REK16015.1 MAG: fatty acid hydroxylase [Acidobacteriota bacterium]REK43696.1 MAG: fatty acid hydroxylase [Acidobacteriota bacterium]
MQFLALTILGFAGMEAFSYVVHRWLFHGMFWGVHKTHHYPRKGAFEMNDLFSVGFALVSVALIVFAEYPLSESIAFPVGLGIAIYGILYFIVHDLFTHRRFLPFISKNSVLLSIRGAHQTHHQTVAKDGQEPYGLFVYNYSRFKGRKSERIDRSVKAVGVGAGRNDPNAGP